MRYMKWVSIDDRFPDEELKAYKDKWPDESGVELIVLIEGAREPTVLEYDGVSFCDRDGTGYPVSYWMRLPPHPDECKVEMDLGDNIEVNYEMFEAIFT